LTVAPPLPCARWSRGYWANGTDRGDRLFLGNLTAWQYSANDVDFCTGPNNETLFIYGMCAQVRRVGVLCCVCSMVLYVCTCMRVYV
jgi:hypothetical protein